MHDKQCERARTKMRKTSLGSACLCSSEEDAFQANRCSASVATLMRTLCAHETFVVSLFPLCLTSRAWRRCVEDIASQKRADSLDGAYESSRCRSLHGYMNALRLHSLVASPARFQWATGDSMLRKLVMDDRELAVAHRTFRAQTVPTSVSIWKLLTSSAQTATIRFADESMLDFFNLANNNVALKRIAHECRVDWLIRMQRKSALLRTNLLKASDQAYSFSGSAHIDADGNMRQAAATMIVNHIVIPSFLTTRTDSAFLQVTSWLLQAMSPDGKFEPSVCLLCSSIELKTFLVAQACKSNASVRILRLLLTMHALSPTDAIVMAAKMLMSSAKRGVALMKILKACHAATKTFPKNALMLLEHLPGPLTSWCQQLCKDIFRPSDAEALCWMEDELCLRKGWLYGVVDSVRHSTLRSDDTVGVSRITSVSKTMLQFQTLFETVEFEEDHQLLAVEANDLTPMPAIHASVPREHTADDTLRRAQIQHDHLSIPSLSSVLLSNVRTSNANEGSPESLLQSAAWMRVFADVDASVGLCMLKTRSDQDAVYAPMRSSHKTMRWIQERIHYGGRHCLSNILYATHALETLSRDAQIFAGAKHSVNDSVDSSIQGVATCWRHRPLPEIAVRILAHFGPSIVSLALRTGSYDTLHEMLVGKYSTACDLHVWNRVCADEDARGAIQLVLDTELRKGVSKGAHSGSFEKACACLRSFGFRTDGPDPNVEIKTAVPTSGGSTKKAAASSKRNGPLRRQCSEELCLQLIVSD